jgi:hypothetical protein
MQTQVQTGKQPAGTQSAAGPAPEVDAEDALSRRNAASGTAFDTGNPSASSGDDGNRQGAAANAASLADDDDLSTRQRIAEEAYRIAQERGFPPDQAMDHWLEAERKLG